MLFSKSVRVTIANREVITFTIILPKVRCIAGAPGLRVVCASKHAIRAILVQDIRIEEDADPGRARRALVADVVGAHRVARRSADAGVVRLRLRECLAAHVRSGRRRRCDDACIAECNWAGEAGQWLGGRCVGV
jgi:hypothetical protein